MAVTFPGTRIAGIRSTLSKILNYLESLSSGSSGSTIAEVKASVVQSQSYSLTETLTGGTWVGGAPIYRKCLALAAGPNNSEVTTAHGIAGVVRFVSMRAVVNATTSHRQLPFVGDPIEDKSPVDPTSIQLRADDTNVYCKASGNYSASAGHIVLEYTKA